MTPEIVDLFKKYKEHTLTEEEYEHLHGWLSESEENRQLMQHFVNMYKTVSRMDALHNADTGKAWARVSGIYRLRRRRLMLRRTLLTAACLLVLFVGGGALYKIMNTPETILNSNVLGIKSNKNLALSSLSSRQSKTGSLQIPAKNITIKFKNQLIRKYVTNGTSPTLTAQLPTRVKSDSVHEQPKYNKDVIPSGQERLVKLPDGTMVYMNAASTLTYPVAFVGKQRAVMLQGEAFFDVKKDTEHPFIVETKFGNVTVLGTAFDVNAYNDLGKCYTTLLRGKIQLTTTNNQTVILTPGQQAVISDGQVYTHDVDVADYVSWMNGVYKFKNATLGQIINTLERWYDIRVVFEDSSVASLTYSGTILRYTSVNAFLDVLVSVGELTYRTEGHTVYISKNIKNY